MAGVDDTIGAWIKAAEASGELEHNPFVGKPFELDDGFEETPVRLRMAYRILKKAGYVPQEVEMLKRLAELREALEAAADPDEATALRREIAVLEPKVRLFVDGLSRTR